MSGYIIFALSIAMGVTCISYRDMAEVQGWTVGELLYKDLSYVKITAFVAIIGGLVKSFIVFQWWSPIAILVVGWLIAFVMTITLKTHTQWVCIIGIFPAFFLTFYY